MKKVLGFKEGGTNKPLTTGNHKMGGSGSAKGKKKHGTKVVANKETKGGNKK